MSVLLGLAVSIVHIAPVQAQFSPARQFPTSWDKIMVFVDQLPSLTAAQRQFAASHYVGTQKQLSYQIDAIRAYNPNFIHIQYRLAVRESSPVFIHRDTWSSDWSVVDAHEDWFVHDYDVPIERVYQSYGSVQEYVMDISGRINGNTTNGWKEYIASEMTIDAQMSHADGIFGDSTHLPYAVPLNLWDSPIGSPPHTAYIDDMEDFYNYIYPALTAANMYWIPNIGGLCTTVDTTTGYYQDVHGAMVEGFAESGYGTADWKMQSNRILNLIRNDKIYIAQNGPSSYSDIARRVWFVSNFLLLKHDKSYLNLLGAGTQMHWAPEYDINIGEPLNQTTPANVDVLLTPSGLHARRFEFGLVLVNGTSSSKSFALGATDPHFLITPWGGGAVDSSGVPAAGGLTLSQLGASVPVAAWGGAILTFAPGDTNADNDVDFSDYQTVEVNFGRTGINRAAGDFDFDGDVDFADYQALEAYFGYRLTAGDYAPEPASAVLLAIGALGLLRRRR